ncbi:hypothetical protein T265_10779 [Opisthorchis viverrini]|uniref:Uncharacterized protein n=1 Tax=Opisthorchis viverrini TaxID=6198 RepID=A0A074ZC01_OPIVI|nr:hypothetical protein T265_10779 [Opisthorchis viverrini]KER20725.1 hypothetical protein T265_10779 [Opisthorchis viverrini]
MKVFKSKLSCAGHCHLPGWGPRDRPHQWLETLRAKISEKYTHLQINLVFTRDSTESLVYDILQLKVLYTGCLMI